MTEPIAVRFIVGIVLVGSGCPRGEPAAVATDIPTTELAEPDVFSDGFPEPIVAGPCASTDPVCEVPLDDVLTGPQDHRPVSTFCHEPSRTCRVMQAHCVDGWCFVPSGTYQAGRDEVGPYNRWGDRELHWARVLRPFWIQRTEVTNHQWSEVMAATASPSLFAACCASCPVADITVFDVAEFANRLSTKAGLAACYRLEQCAEADGETGAGRTCDAVYFDDPTCPGYRLPTEVEWELAARAGSSSCLDNGFHAFPEPHCHGRTVEPALWQRAWFCGNSAVSYTPCVDLSSRGGEAGSCMGVQHVGSFSPNRLGLHDMSGNVGEMTGALFDTLDYDAIPRGASFDDPGHAPLIRRDDAVRGRGGDFVVASAFVCTFSRRGVAAVQEGKFGRSGFRLVRLATEEGALR